jgi:hypothetical protein
MPQLVPSICVFTQAAPHLSRPTGQERTHADPTHFSPAPQTLPHVPQFRLSLVVSLQVPLQVANEPQVVVHTPALQTWPAAHALPQVPQLAASTLVSLQVPVQLVSVPHEVTHAPALQT